MKIESIVFAEEKGLNIAQLGADGEPTSFISTAFQSLHALRAAAQAMLGGKTTEPLVTIEGIKVGEMFMGIIPKVDGNVDLSLYANKEFKYSVTDEDGVFNRVITFGTGVDEEGNDIAFLGDNMDVPELVDHMKEVNGSDALAEGLVLDFDMLEELVTELSTRIEELNL